MDQMTCLWFFDASIVSVAHGADVNAFLPFQVSLEEELFRYSFRPLTIQLQGLGWVAEVGTMDKTLQNLQQKSTELLITCYYR